MLQKGIVRSFCALKTLDSMRLSRKWRYIFQSWETVEIETDMCEMDGGGNQSKQKKKTRKIETHLKCLALKREYVLQYQLEKYEVERESIQISTFLFLEKFLPLVVLTESSPTLWGKKALSIDITWGVSFPFLSPLPFPLRLFCGICLCVFCFVDVFKLRYFQNLQNCIEWIVPMYTGYQLGFNIFSTHLNLYFFVCLHNSGSHTASYCDFAFMVWLFLVPWMFSPVVFDNTRNRTEYKINLHVTIPVHIAGRGESEEARNLTTE